MLIELGHQEVTTPVNRQFLILIFKELTNLVTRLASFNKGQPITARTKRIGIGDNLHLVSRPKFGIKRHHPAIDLGTNRFFPNLGVDFIGKIDRSRILWKGTDSPIWGKDINLFSQIVFLDRIDKFLGIIRLVLEFHHLLDPVHPNSRFLAVDLTLDTFFIGPVSRNPILGNLVHFLGSDLELNWPFRTVYSRMDGLIAICLPVGNIVLKTPRHWLPELMDVA